MKTRGKVQLLNTTHGAVWWPSLLEWCRDKGQTLQLALCADLPGGNPIVPCAAPAETCGPRLARLATEAGAVSPYHTPSRRTQRGRRLHAQEGRQ
jgi:hypothetical protein